MTMVPPAPGLLYPPHPQLSVDRFILGLDTAHKLLTLYPRTAGHPGNAAALAPAIVLGVMAAFEGFAEDFTAIAMAHSGSSYGEIAKKIGRWNNPTLRDFHDNAAAYFPAAAMSIRAGDPIEVWKRTRIVNPVWVRETRAWSTVLEESRSWMQVRHLLAHGLTTGRKIEYWPGPLNPNDPPASAVLAGARNGQHSLGLYGAMTCARIYSRGARIIADAVAVNLVAPQVLDWSRMPEFS